MSKHKKDSSAELEQEAHKAAEKEEGKQQAELQATEEKAAQEEEKEESLSETEALQAELQQEKDKYMRLFAEFENYKRRTGKERVEMFKTAGQEVMLAMLPVLDDFDRAIKEIKKSDEGSHYEGVELINSKLRETLRKQGLEQMNVKEGDKFDADLHDAVTQIPAPKKKLKGKIVDVIEKGYTLGDKIIRYPKVVTGK